MENYLLKDLNVPSSILSSGEEYFSEGLVHLLNEDGSRYEAEVDGSKTYKTSITIKNSHIASFSCTCPYPHLCKHVVALSLLVSKEKDNVFNNLKRKIKRAAFNESLDEFKGLPYKINSFGDKITKEEYISLISCYFIEMCKSDYLYDSSASTMRLEIFTSKHALSEEEYGEIIESSIEYLKNDSISVSRLLNVFLKEEDITNMTQEFIIKNIENRALPLKQFMIGVAGKNLPAVMLPEFILLVSKCSPRVLAKEDLLQAKRFFIKEDSFDDLLTILNLLVTRNDPSSFEDSDFVYLSKNGFSSEARKIAFSLLKISDDFKDYLRFRKLFNEKEFYNVRYQVESAITYKKYLNTVLLFDGKEFFPSLYESFSYMKLNHYEIYLAKEFITDSKDIHILNERAHQYIKTELNKKNRNKDYFYCLLYLDYLKDDSLSFYLFDKAVLSDKEEKTFKGIWLYLINKYNLLSREAYMPYLREKYVFD